MRFSNCTIRRVKGSKTWYTRKRIGGKQIYITAPTQLGVREKLKELIDASPRKKANGMTLHQWYNRWLELFKLGKVKKATISDYEKTLKKIPSEILNSDIKKINSIQIIEMLKSISAERMRQKAYELLKALFEKAFLHGFVKNNIINIIEKPTHEREKGIALNHEQQLVLIDACQEIKSGDLFLTCLFQGLRIGEALAITQGDINFSTKRLNINKSINEQGILDTTKNKQSIRNMPIFENTISVLEKYKNLQADERLFSITYYTAVKSFKKLLQKHNLPNISLHDLRHTFITNCKNAEIPEHIIQTWVGHQIGSKVTSSIYTHITEDVNLSNIDKLNNSKYYSLTTQKKEKC